MDSKTQQVLGELKAGKDAQTAAWLSHPTDYTDLVTSVETAASGAGQEVSIGNTLATLANMPLYEDAPEGENMFPQAFVSTDQEDVTSYPNYLSTVLQDFAAQVTEYKANAAEEQPIIYAPPLPIDTQETHSLAYCFATCQWLVSIDSYNGSAYATDIARLNAATNCTAMFRDCSSLASLPGLWTFNSLSNANNMFNGCLTLTNLPDNFLGQNIINCDIMFSRCQSLQELPSGFTLANASGGQIFRLCKKLSALPSGFDLGNCTTFGQSFYRCESLRELRPDSLTFKMSIINNVQSQGEYSTDSTYNAMYQMFQEIGFDDYEDETSDCITNEFTIDTTVQGYTGGIKFDLILWHNGFQKLSPASVASLLHCLYDYATNDPTYTNRIPSGCTNGNRLVPTVVASSAIEDALYDLFDEEYQTDLDAYMESIGWEIRFV